MNRLSLATILFVVFCNIVSAQQSPNKTSLIISKCKTGEDVCRIQELFKYNFESGEFVSKEKILDSETLPSGLEDSIIYKNRYIVTKFADVIDLEKKQVIHSGSGFLFDIKNDQIIEIVEDWWAKSKKIKTGVFSFDLQTGTSKEIKSNEIWKYPGEWSPDRTMSANYVSGKGLEIYTVGKGTKILNIPLGVDETIAYCCCRPKVPLTWIDNKRLLSQKENGELVIVGLDGKITPFAKITKEQTCGPSLNKDVEGNLIYHYGNSYIVDINNSSVDPLVFKKQGNDFTSKFEKNLEENGREIYSFYFEDRKIGELQPNNIKTTRGNIAVEFESSEKNAVYPIGIKIWNDIKKDWVIFEIDWLPTVIGWVE